MTHSARRTDNSASTSTDVAPRAGRSVVSLLLVVHLFVVFVVLGSHVSPSGLQGRLLTLFAPYVDSLNFDLSSGGLSDARFHLTRTTVRDFPTTVEITVESDGEKTTVVLPAPERTWGPRARRERALVGVYADLSANEDTAARIARSVGAAVMAQYGVDRAAIVCRRPEMRENTQQSGFMPAPLSDERFEIVQEGQLVTILGEINYLPSVQRGRAAQVVPSARPKSTTAIQQPVAEQPRSSPLVPSDG